MSTRDTATRLIVMRVLQDRVRTRDAAMRSAASSAGFDVAGVRDVGLVGEEVIGTVQVTAGSETWNVTDEAALLEWVRANAPTEVEQVERVRPAFLTRLLGDVKAGEFSADTVPDGITRRLGSPTLSVKPAPDAAKVIEQAVADGRIRWADVLELEPTRPSDPDGAGQP